MMRIICHSHTVYMNTVMSGSTTELKKTLVQEYTCIRYITTYKTYVSGYISPIPINR